MPKICIIGHARHGKDTAAEILQNDFGLSFVSSSRFVGEKAVWPQMKHLYTNFEACFEDRHNWRGTWFNAISDYNQEDPTRLTRELLHEYDLYVGLRNMRELFAAQRAELFDLTIWIDASRRVGPEDARSISVEPWMADEIVSNNFEPKLLRFNLHRVVLKHFRDLPYLGAAKEEAQ